MAIESLIALGLAVAFLGVLTWYVNGHRQEDQVKPKPARHPLILLAQRRRKSQVNPSHHPQA